MGKNGYLSDFECARWAGLSISEIADPPSGFLHNHVWGLKKTVQ